MNIINPSVELWENINNRINNLMHIMKCAKVCYASNIDNITPENAEKFVKDKIKQGHLSILRHGSAYFKIPEDYTYINRIENLIYNNTYCKIVYAKDNKGKRCLWISTNLQHIRNYLYLYNNLKDFETDFLEFYNNEHAKYLCRYTFLVCTQIATSRELNRVSPNAILEQSTRYVNFGNKNNGITICKPHWFDSCTDEKKLLYIDVCKAAEEVYLELLRQGMKPEDARGSLPLDTATKVVYTYSIKEWEHILNLRYFGTTGKPHPNAYIIAEKIHQFLIDEGYEFDNEFK